MTVAHEDASWLQSQYRQAWRAAADARGGRRDGRSTLDPRDASAIARMVALGQVMQRFDAAVPSSAREPVTSD